MLDLYPQINFLSPKILNMSFEQFKNCYCEYYIRGKLKNKVKKQYNIENLISKVEPYIFDCELDLKKDKKYQSFFYQVEDKNKYEEIKRSHLDFQSDISFFSDMSKMKKKEI